MKYLLYILPFIFLVGCANQFLGVETEEFHEPFIVGLKIEDVRMPEYELMDKKLYINTNLYNQFVAQGESTTLSCGGRDFFTCLDEDVNKKLKKYKITEIKVYSGDKLEKFKIE